MNNTAFEPLAPGDPLVIGGYRVLGVVRSGVRSRVYLAATQSGRRLTVRVVRPLEGEEADFRVRFRKAMDAARRVHGIRVAAVVDAHADADTPDPWMAAEYVAGPSLAQAVATWGPLPPEAVRILVAGVAEALRDIHAAEVVHGALMPTTVLLTDDGPRVIDFGIAAAGSPDADVLALGGIAFYAATGHQAEAVDPADHLDALHPIIGRCLSEIPADRPLPEQVIAALEVEPGVPTPGWLPAGVIGQPPEEPPLPEEPPELAPPAAARSTAPRMLPPVTPPDNHTGPIPLPKPQLQPQPAPPPAVPPQLVMVLGIGGMFLLVFFLIAIAFVLI